MQKGYTICVSGAAKGSTIDKDYLIAFDIGKKIAQKGHTMISGATSGLPDWAAQGAKSSGGMSIGISPAASRLEHIEKYRLPTESYDFIMFSGMHYMGRDTLLIQSSDAVISVGGRMGTIHEFATAFEAHKPVGVVMEGGGTGEQIESLMKAAGVCHNGTCNGAHDVIFGSDIDKLIDDLVKILDEKYKNNQPS
jgi:uncharacterized protein (TIGR00725 family)